MGEVTLSTGKVVKIDTSKMTHGEWEDFIAGSQVKKKDYEFIEKVTGVVADDWRAMLHDDSRRLVLGIIKAANAPLDPPN